MFHFRTGYLEDGVLQTDSTKLRQHYMNSTTFYVDCLCLLPLDFLYLSLGFKSILRIFRFERISQYPMILHQVVQYMVLHGAICTKNLVGLILTCEVFMLTFLPCIEVHSENILVRGDFTIFHDIAPYDVMFV